MSDQEVPGPRSAGGKRFDARDTLRRKLEGMRSTETDGPASGDGASKVIRLPRRPRHVQTESDRRSHRPSDGDSVYDPAETRPVLRSELQGDTGHWPIDPGATTPPTPGHDPGDVEDDRGVVDLDELRRSRAGENPRPTRVRRIARPRRIAKNASEEPGTDSNRDAGSDTPPSIRPPRRH